MEILKELLPVVISGSLAALVVAIGLDSTLDDVLYVLRRPALLVRAVLSVNVVVPLAAWLLVSLFPLSPIAKAGIVLMAVSPVPPLAPGKEMKLGAAKSYAYGLYVALALLSILVVPATIAVLNAIYPAHYAISVAAVAAVVVSGVLVPLAVGLAVRRFAPDFAARAAPIVAKFSMLLLVLAVVPVLIAVWPALHALIGDGTVLAMAAVALIALAAGHLLGGPSLGDRAALAVASATRHPGIALVIANANFEDKRVSAAVLLFLLVGLLAALPYQVWIKRKARAA